MTSQTSRTTSVEIIDANNVIVGTTTTQADGSFSCTVPAGLGEHVFTARSGDETSSTYTVNGVPSQTIRDDFEDWPLQGFTSGVTKVGPNTQTSFTVYRGIAGIRKEIGGGANNHVVYLSYGEFEIKPKYPSKKVRFSRLPSADPDAKVTYYGKDGNVLAEKNLGGVLFITFESDVSIYSMVVKKSSETLWSDEQLDNFQFIYN